VQHHYDGYEISDDPKRIELDTVARFLSSSYWASGRSREIIERSIEHSLCIGAYRDGEQVAFARVVTDFAVMFWICDVFVAEEHRGRGLGKTMMARILEDARLCQLTGLLATKDAHSLYAQFGFRREGERLMYRFSPQVVASMSHAGTKAQS
jgi:GNAT superfamily N-acetyltransferase